MNIGARLLILGAVMAVSASALEPLAAAPMLRDGAARLASPAKDAAEFCLPGWRLNFHSRCVPQRRRWWFR
ncbi:hypothetical protein B1812_03155 [Methylocystis bryophila]|uniref:Uncharacterized protein n=1 Tax=Methylocystis bryophila TaxID=655015 RepID=A0A1W6MRM3_9HYPH|nr:hypothetical protein B1812_03155 [Methylocystis bryophila]